MRNISSDVEQTFWFWIEMHQQNAVRTENLVLTESLACSPIALTIMTMTMNPISSSEVFSLEIHEIYAIFVGKSHHPGHKFVASSSDGVPEVKHGPYSKLGFSTLALQMDWNCRAARPKSDKSGMPFPQKSNHSPKGRDDSEANSNKRFIDLIKNNSTWKKCHYAQP